MNAVAADEPGWVVLHGGALGDLVLTIQLALQLGCDESSPGIHLLARTSPGDLGECVPPITWQSAETVGLHWLFGGSDRPPGRLAKAVSGNRVLNALGGPDAPPHRRLKGMAPAALYSFDPRPRPGITQHITRQWRVDLERQGLAVQEPINPAAAGRSVKVPEALRRRGRACLRHLGLARPETAVVIHPGGGSRAKCWPLANFLATARRLRAAGREVVFLVGPVELEWWSAGALEPVASEFPLLKQPEPNELSAVLAGAGALVGNDSGPAHLAALLGTRTVVLFGPTPATVWQPLGRDVRVVAGDARVHPDHWGLAVEQVSAALE